MKNAGSISQLLLIHHTHTKKGCFDESFFFFFFFEG